MLDLVIPSPLDAHTVRLKVVGEIRYGPTYSAVFIDEVEVPGLQVGDNAEWLSPHVVALQEWLHVAGREGPDTRVLLIDAERRRSYRTSVVDRGLVEDFRFRDGVLSYRKNYFGHERPPGEEATIALADIDAWVDLG